MRRGCQSEIVEQVKEFEGYVEVGDSLVQKLIWAG